MDSSEGLQVVALFIPTERALGVLEKGRELSWRISLTKFGIKPLPYSYAELKWLIYYNEDEIVVTTL
jgi:hypothetical protein